MGCGLGPGAATDLGCGFLRGPQRARENGRDSVRAAWCAGFSEDLYARESVGSSVGVNNGFFTGAGFSTGMGVGATYYTSAMGAGLGAGLGADLGAGSGEGWDVVLEGNLGAWPAAMGLGSDVAPVAGLEAGLGSDLDLSAGPDVAVGLEAGLGSDLDLGAGLDAAVALEAGLGSDLAPDAVVGLKAGLGSDLDAGLGAGPDFRSKANLGAGSAVGLGTGSPKPPSAGLSICTTHPALGSTCAPLPTSEPPTASGRNCGLPPESVLHKAMHRKAQLLEGNPALLGRPTRKWSKKEVQAKSLRCRVDLPDDAANDFREFLRGKA